MDHAQDMVEILASNRQFDAVRQYWDVHEESYVYNGTGGNQSVMGTVILFKGNNLL